MNSIFKSHLRRFVLVFFNDILIYSKDKVEHLIHLETVVELLRSNNLVAKKRKCFFGGDQILYLGYIISSQDVMTNLTKVRAVEEWPIAESIKQLKGFLGLMSYYRRFVKDYGHLARPLLDLFKGSSF